MTELKTLKDFNLAEGMYIPVYELKFEAIKWVKEFERQNEDMGGLRGNWEIDFIKLFFNLTEADLK